VPAPPGKPARSGAKENQALMQTVVRTPSAWTPEVAREMAERCNLLAPTWDAERASYRPAPLIDALDRGGPWPTGRCLEIGSGTGTLTQLLERARQGVVCVDIAWEMLVRALTGQRVQADAARLPIADGAAAVVVVGDAPLFATEVVRVLRADGVVVWVNALGHDAPFHVPTPMLVEALASASGGAAWDALESEALWGSWAVLRRPAHRGTFSATY
jgi:SAM-dependent methyltransferase